MWLAPLVTIAGMGLYPVVLNTGYLKFPWFVLVFACLGLGLAWYSWSKKNTLWRLFMLLLCFGLLGLELWFIFYHSKLPAYAGPLSEGKTLPAFTAKLSDGKAFTQDALVSEQDTVIVFYRGLF